MNNDDLGYQPAFEAGRIELGLSEFPVARVINESKGAYRVKNADGEFLARITGKSMFTAASREDYPAVGDWVALSILGEEQAVIRGILPRQTILKRRHGDKSRVGKKDEMQIIAANIDVAFIVESVDRDFSLNRFERYFAIGKDGGVESAIVLNKVDLLSPEELAEKLRLLEDRFPGIDIISASTVSGRGLDDLRRYIAKGKTYCFLGSSGVGKSSLINTLLGESIIKTSGVSSYSGRGKHTTTGRQMYFLENGGIVIDNPGIREVGMSDAGMGVASSFDDITELAKQCKYTDCTHAHEPGCVVIDAVRGGKLDAEKYSNYLGLKKEVEFYEMSNTEKREKDKRFGKFIKTAKKYLKRSNF